MINAASAWPQPWSRRVCGTTRPREATRKGGLRIQEAQAQLRLHDGRCQEPSRSQRSAWEGAPHTCHLRPALRGSGEISVHRTERPGPPQSPCPCSLASALSSQTGQSNIRVSIISWFSTCHRMMSGGKKGEAEGDADRQECTSFSWGGDVS